MFCRCSHHRGGVRAEGLLALKLCVQTFSLALVGEDKRLGLQRFRVFLPCAMYETTVVEVLVEDGRDVQRETGVRTKRPTKYSRLGEMETAL